MALEQESGFDPHVAFERLDGENFFEYMLGVSLPIDDPGDWVHRCFMVRVRVRTLVSVFYGG